MNTFTSTLLAYHIIFVDQLSLEAAYAFCISQLTQRQHPFLCQYNSPLSISNPEKYHWDIQLSCFTL
jgi:hypothetical protein